MPILSGFTAVPNPQMLAFMATQSFVMMMQAGEGWQYGKRKQSAMTNEEFNKQTPLSIMQRQMRELKAAIPSIVQNMNNMTPMVSNIIEQYGDFVKTAIAAVPQAVENTGIASPIPLANASSGETEQLDILKLITAHADTGATNQKTNAANNSIEWQPLVQALAKWLLGGAPINLVSDRNTYKSPDNPEQTLFDNIPEDENLSGAELTSAENDLAYRKAQELKAQKARELLAATKYRTPPPTVKAIRKTSIAESGQSPLAAKAVATFKANIDRHVALVNDMVRVARGQLNVGQSLSDLPYYHRFAVPLINKLSALRIKFRSTYGYNY